MNRAISVVALLIAVSAFSGCQSTRVAEPSIAPPALRLTSSAPLQLADGCQPDSSVIVDFTVQPDGSTSAIKTPAVAGCLHDALTAWVASFRYSPPGVAVPGTVEWLLVTAKKRG